MKIERIELKTFISKLVELYNKGVDYVDLRGDREPTGEPSLHILYSEDYLSEEARENLHEKNDNITDTDINQLL